MQFILTLVLKITFPLLSSKAVYLCILDFELRKAMGRMWSEEVEILFTVLVVPVC